MAGCAGEAESIGDQASRAGQAGIAATDIWEGMMELTTSQTRLLCDIATRGAIEALLFSPSRSEGPALREMGLIVGVGDSTTISADAHAILNAKARGAA